MIRLPPNSFRILSIDFDYFQDTTENTVKQYYPDGVDLPSNLTSVIWSSVYSKNSPGYEAIQNVKVNQELLNQAKNLILSQEDIPVVFTQSHLGIWKEIKNRCVRGQNAFLTHIDFHDDMMNGNEKLGIIDCGNWISFFMKFCHTKMIWFTRYTAMKLYGIKPGELPIFADDLSYLLRHKQQYDFIFICRSDPWTPPHLDPEFNNLIDLCRSNFSDVSVEDTVEKPRSMKDILNIAQQIDNCYTKFMSGGGL